MTTLSDPLSLPAVPAPAAADHPWRDRVLVALFVLALPAFALFDPLRGAASHWEQRAPADWPPAAQLVSPAKFASDFEHAFADRFGARSALIVLQHAALIDLFGVSPVANRVLVGHEGWLYWLGEDGRSLDRNYRGLDGYPDDVVVAVATELKRRHDYLAARGIPYIVVVVPEKFTIYPEHLPGWVAPATAPTFYARVMDRLAADGGVTAIDLRPLLRAAKSRDSLYYQTDSHWNMAGAAIGYDAIMREIAKALPGRFDTFAPPQRPPYTPGVDLYWGDLARIVGVPFRYHEPDFVPIWKLYANPASLCGKRVDAQNDPSLEIYACDRPGLPRLVALRDSMAIPLVLMLSENFSRAVYTSHRQLEPAMIDREQPDVVIEEMVERALHSPAAAPMP